MGLDTETQEEVLIKTFGNDEGQLKICDCVSVELKSKQSEFSMQFNLLEVDQICSPLKGQAIRWAQKEYPHLQGLKLADFPSETETELEVDLMLGGDTLWPIMTSEIVHGSSKDQPVAVGTKFGWVLAGPVNNVPRSLLSCVNLTKAHVLHVDVECEPRVSSYSNESDQVMDQKVSELFELEALGITEIDSVHETFVKDIRFENGHYVVKLPWRQHHDILPDNFELSSGRLISTLKRLKKDPPLLKEYDRIINEQLQNGIIEQVYPLVEPHDQRVHYLSHHPVVREDAATTKVRIVMDASAKITADTPSLNECLYTGPSLTRDIIDILIRFRWYRIGIVSDIEKAFHMIHVDEKHRDALRFLWVQDIDSVDPKLLILHFIGVVFGLNCSPFILGGTLEHHISKYQFDDPYFAKKLLESIYVDDVINGAETPMKALNFYEESKACLAAGGFQLQKWKTSDKQLQALIDKGENQMEVVNSGEKFESDDLSYTKAVIGETIALNDSEQKVLGLRWDSMEDELSISFEKVVMLSDSLLLTKRNLLKLSASIFDSSELRPGFQGKIRILHIYASLMLFPQAIRNKLRVQVDDGHRYVTGL